MTSALLAVSIESRIALSGNKSSSNFEGVKIYNNKEAHVFGGYHGCDSNW